MRPLEKLNRRCKDQGLAAAAAWALREFSNRVVRLRRCDVLLRSLDRPHPKIRSRLECEFLSISPDSRADVERFLAAWPSQRRLFERRFARAQRCISCFRGDKGIGYIWITDTPERDDNLGLAIRPLPEETYGFDLWVMPEHRVDLVGQELIARWLDDSLARGRRRAIGVVDARNKPMQVTTRVVFGFKPAERVTSLEFLAKRGMIIQRRLVR